MNTNYLEGSQYPVDVLDYALREGRSLHSTSRCRVADVPSLDIGGVTLDGITLDGLALNGVTLDALEGVGRSPDGRHVAWVPPSGGAPHWFRPGHYLFLRMAVWFGGFMCRGSNKTGQPKGLGKFYVRLRYPDGQQFSVDRIIADAQPGERVSEPFDYHMHDPDLLTKGRDGRSRTRTSKFNLGRPEAIQAALAQYDRSVRRGIPAPISREQYRTMLELLLLIGDNELANA